MLERLGEFVHVGVRAWMHPSRPALASALGLGAALTVAACSAGSGGHAKATSSADMGGLTCDATNITMPADIPDIPNCINNADGDGPDSGCRGWTKLGNYQTSSDELRSAGNLGAQLYMIEPDSSTLCLYLYRGDATQSLGTLNGIHCYNTTTCDVCWWDGSTAAGVAPTADVLRHVAADGSDCSDCHRTGPILPKFDLWSAASDTTQPLHKTCSAAGGPNWIQAPDAWPLSSSDTSKIVDAPAGCRGNSCHGSGFVSGGSYCQMVRHSFADDNGSMRGAGKKFASKTGCETFRDAMGCAAGDIACDDEAVATPDPTDTGDSGTPSDDSGTSTDPDAGTPSDPDASTPGDPDAMSSNGCQMDQGQTCIVDSTAPAECCLDPFTCTPDSPGSPVGTCM
jgi:hypothetical protein